MPLGSTYNAVNTDFTTSSCIPRDRYIFTMKDNYGDGMCCDYGKGKFTVSYDGAMVVQSNAISNGFVTGFDMTSDEFGDECSPTTPPTSAVSEICSLFSVLLCRYHIFHSYLLPTLPSTLLRSPLRSRHPRQRQPHQQTNRVPSHQLNLLRTSQVPRRQH